MQPKRRYSPTRNPSPANGESPSPELNLAPNNFGICCILQLLYPRASQGHYASISVSQLRLERYDLFTLQSNGIILFDMFIINHYL